MKEYNKAMVAGGGSPHISIIIPVYNTSKYLRQTLDSVIRQSFTDWELIIVDDGSTDDSGLVCDEYAARDMRIRVIHKPNGGVSSARNVGIKAAVGQYISFIDGDDYVERDFLEKMYCAIENHHADIVCCRLVFGSSRGSWSQKAHATSFYNRKEAIVQMLLPFSYHGWPVNKLYRKDIIANRELLFDEKLKYCEDEVFVLQYLLSIERCVYLPDALYHYVQNENSANNSIYTQKTFNRSCLDRHKADEMNLQTIRHLNDKTLERAFKARMFDSFMATSDKLLATYRDEKDVWDYLKRNLRKYYFYHLSTKGFRRNWVIETKFLIRVISPGIYKRYFIKQKR